MIVLVCGSRTWDDPDIIRDYLDELIPGVIVLTGGARGADSMAHDIAGELGLMRKVMPADWLQYGKRAGYLRNIAMLDTGPGLVLAFWDGESKGTLHTINEATKRGIKVEIIRSRPDRADHLTRLAELGL